ncbi:hypothetical protein ACFQV2_24660 [Actinokineospora soli]|uniref:Uncharacterized protein n=1 Tax=Actinokineospora soli TaxID=1048753 RepID=A0ABW2TTD7_9PSEU
MASRPLPIGNGALGGMALGGGYAGGGLTGKVAARAEHEVAAAC